MIIQDVLRKYNIHFTEEGKDTRPGWINLACPFCGKDPYLGINLAGLYASCWACGYHPLGVVLVKLTGMRWSESQTILGEFPRIAPTRSEHTGRLRMPTGVGPVRCVHEEYLHSRGFEPSHIRHLWQVSGIGQTPHYLRWRLFLPIHLAGKVVSWTTRSIIKDFEPRYLSAPDEDSAVPVGNCLYGVDHVRQAAVIVEGPLDVWAIGPGAVAIMGLRLSAAQLEQLTRIPNRYICFDNEPAAQERARALCQQLSIYEGTTWNVTLKSGKDAAAADKSEIELLRKEAGLL